MCDSKGGTMRNFFFLFAAVSLSLMLGGCRAKRPVEISPGPMPQPVTELKTVYYDFDRSEIREDQVDTLLSNAAVLKDSSYNVIIEGHCDERGTNEYNIALGDRRARSAKDYLINLGIDPARMSASSFGEERPVCTGHDESCWWQNRRAQFVK